MDFFASLWASFAAHWSIWLVSVVLVVAAVIDGVQLRVPNWVTYPLVFAGWVYSGVAFGWEGFGWSLGGTAVGLACLLPLYAVGGMGAGDVKLLAGVGAWIYATHTFHAFCVSAIVGAVLAVAIVAWKREWRKHIAQFRSIVMEFLTIRNAEQLAAIAAERKSSMLLLPYGIPLMLGTIIYFVWNGMLV